MQNSNTLEKQGHRKPRQGFILLLLFLLGCTFLIPGILYYRKAFPEASIDFKLSKKQASFEAQRFLKSRGIDLTDYYETVHFDYDAAAKTYLDREVGVETMNALLSGEVYLWSWKIRWFKPHERKEYEVLLSPEGRVVGFQRILPEEEGMLDLTQEEALQAAEVFLRQDVNVPLDRYSLIEQNVSTLKNRKDLQFTWQHNDFQAADSEYRITVTVQGHEIGLYESFIKIPEEWKRDYTRMRSRNQLLQKITLFLTLPLLIMAPIILLIRMRRRDICWRVTLILSLCIFVSHVLLGINSIPLILSQFDTTQSMGSFTGNLFLSIFIQALLSAVIIFLIVGASEPLYREQNPMRLSFSKALTFRFFKTEEFFSSTIIGYSLALFHIGYVVLFYYFGRRVGIWSPTEVGYTEALSTFLPWIYPLTVSLTASLTEELFFRVFAISLLRKILPTWVAVLIPALLWGFLHSNYPQQPSFIRGVEVAILGIIAGYIFLRWGILATLIWHYTVDAVFVGLFLFSSSNLYFIFSGSIVMGLLLIPLILALFSLAKERRFSATSGLLNRDESELMKQKKGEIKIAVPLKRIEPSLPEFPVLTKQRYMTFIALIMISLIIMVIVKMPRPWVPVQLGVNAAGAKALASNYLKEKGVVTDPFYKAVTFSNYTGSHEDRYIQNVSGWEGLREAYRLFKETSRWKVRFFLPMNEEEYIVFMDEAGQDPFLTHLLPESREAPSIAKDEIMEKAERFLMDERKIPLEEYALVDSYEDQKTSRTDNHLVWKWEKEKPGEGEYRIAVSLAGNEVTGYSRFIKVPENWVRQDQEEGILQVLFSFLKVLMLSLGGGLVVVLFVKDFINRHIEWKRVIIVPAFALLCYVLLEVNQARTILSHYETSFSLSNFLFSEVLSFFLQGTGLFLFFTVLTVAMLSLYREIYGKASLWPNRLALQKSALASSFLTGISAFFVMMAFARTFAWLNGKLDIPRSRIVQEPLHSVETFLPFVDISLRAIVFAIIATLLIFIGVFIFQRYLRKTVSLFIVALPAIAIYFIDDVKNFSEFMLLFITSAIAFAIAFLFLKLWIRENILSCFLAILWLKTIPLSLALMNQPLWYYRIHGFLACLLVISPLILLLTLINRKNRGLTFFWKRTDTG